MPQSGRRVARLVMDINPPWKPPGPFSSTVNRPGSRTTLPRGQPEVWLSCAKRALAARLPMQGLPTSPRGCCPISGGGGGIVRVGGPTLTPRGLGATVAVASVSDFAPQSCRTRCL